VAGYGGAGALSSGVTVTNDASIQTTGAGSTGIYALSDGGDQWTDG